MTQISESVIRICCCLNLQNEKCRTGNMDGYNSKCYMQRKPFRCLTEIAKEFLWNRN